MKSPIPNRSAHVGSKPRNLTVVIFHQYECRGHAVNFENWFNTATSLYSQRLNWQHEKQRSSNMLPLATLKLVFLTRIQKPGFPSSSRGFDSFSAPYGKRSIFAANRPE